MNRCYKKKLNSRAGFTLTEMLLAVLILLMVSVIVITGIPAAKNAYEKVVLASNAQVLMSTTITTLRNELGTANDIKGDDTAGMGVTYYNMTRGAVSRIYIDSSKNEIYLDRYYSGGGLMIVDGPDDDLILEAKPLVLARNTSAKISADELYVTYESVDSPEVTGNNTVVFHKLKVMRKINGGSSDSELLARNSLTIRVISEE